MATVAVVFIVVVILVIVLIVVIVVDSGVYYGCCDVISTLQWP